MSAVDPREGATPAPVGAAHPPRPDTLAHRAQRAARATNGRLADLLCVNVSAVEQWRSGARTPSGPSRRLLELLAHWPDETMARLDALDALGAPGAD